MTASEEVRALYESDQSDRTVGYDNIDFKKMRENDVPRLARGKEIYAQLKQNEISLAGEELFFLAHLFQHSPANEDILTAREIALLAAENGYQDGNWLAAAAEDRYLLRTGGKQKWGTQFTKENGVWRQDSMQTDEESGVTDEMRKQKGVPARAEQMQVFLAQTDI